ncbi:MAG: radical SAM protein [Bdellovibrionales bacterium]
MKEFAFDSIPFSEIVRLGQISQLYRDLFCTSWILGRFCNYKCSYCWPYASTKTRDHRPFSQIVSTMQSIKSQARERGFNSFHFSFSGGEPTAHPNYLDVLEHYSSDTKSLYQSVHMTSNLSPGLKWFERYAHATRSLHRVSITASFHKEFADRIAFAEKLLFLQEQNIQITINMVMVPTRFDVLWQDALYFHEQGLNVTLKPQSNENATKVVDGYTPEQLLTLKRGLPQMDFTTNRIQRKGIPNLRPKSPLHIDSEPSAEQKIRQIMQLEMVDRRGRKWYLDQAERLNAFEFNNFKGWICSAGYRSIIIREPGGVVKRSYSCHDQPLGSIDSGFQLFDQLKPCVTPSCVSSADSKIPKRRAESSLPLWPEGVPPT